MTPVPRPGECRRCAAPLDGVQRYCVACGERRGESPTAIEPVNVLAAPPPTGPPARLLRGRRPVPSRRSLGATATVVLAGGMLIGAALGPALTPSSLASTARQVFVMAPTPMAGGASALAAATSGADTSGSALAPPTGNVDASSADSGSGASSTDTGPVASAAGSGGGSSSGGSGSAGSPATPSDTGGGGGSTTTPGDGTTTTGGGSGSSASADSSTVSGTVVHVSHDKHAYAVATKEGQLIALHARKPPELGTKVKATVKALANGTFDEVDQKTSAIADKVKFHGTVTFVDAEARVYTVSARGVSMLVRAPAAPAPPETAPALPAVGTQTTVDASIAAVPGGDPAVKQVTETAREDGEKAAAAIDLEAIVRSTSPDGAQIAVSADDAGESPQTIVIKVPQGVDVKKLAVDAVILGTARLEADGTWTLVSAGDDSDAKVADRAP